MLPKDTYRKLFDRKRLVLLQIKKYKIDDISEDDLNTWTIGLLSKLESKVNLHIRKSKFKHRLNACKNVTISAEVLENILGSEDDRQFNKSIEDLPENIKMSLGYLKKVKPKKIATNSGKAKNNKKGKSKSKKNRVSQSVWAIYTPMGNRR